MSAVSVDSILATLALRIRTIFLDLTLTNADLILQDTRTSTAEFALQVTITILPTILIAGFLVSERRRHRNLIGVLQLPTPYMNVVAMLVESYAVESTWAILLLIFYNLDHPVQVFFGNTQLYILIIAYLLVQYRVASGRAYGSQRARESQSRRNHLSSLHWNHTTPQSDGASGTDTNSHHPENKPEPKIFLVQGSPA
ncbi:hypothetical protein Agabi119p4_10403 [Agaricus bisporus var. burnettii]|uniref:Uncharacterized protein n=1 Tax=Agaricus bisporus var. burnettii TaxID=192524 RepID=A0A8H7C1H4_AGABI|nr:hypothetical protein Agabi119p4_10403 [Agaricus bisporus var. burnettii]